jgi:ribosomal protein S18 acetylase RimI-like enzyme
MKIRELDFKDREAVLSLLDQSYEELKGNPDLGECLRLKRPARGRSRGWFAKLYNNELRDGNCIFYVAEQDGNVVGFCSVTKKDIPDSEMSHIGTLGMRVGEGFRGEGIGTALLRHTLDKCRGKFEIIELYVFASNKDAKRLYKRFGFRTWGTAPRYIKRGARYMDLEYMSLGL